MAELKGSPRRVLDAARALDLTIEMRTMPASTRTAEEAATACGCAVARIVKSLVFAAEGTGQIVLLLVSGANRVDPVKAESATGHRLVRADARRVREVTGFAIGGVAPIGSLAPLPVYLDQTLLAFDTVWAAGGGPQVVFEVDPRALAERTGAAIVALS